MTSAGGLGRQVSVATAAALVVAVLGGLMTDIGPWYLALRQPGWKPPDWAFGPIWTTIFTLCVAAGVIGWRRAPTHDLQRRMLGLFALNGVLNVCWSLLYFRLQRPDWALAEVPFLWMSVLALVLTLRRVAPAPSWLLVPYLLWVSTAAVLNWDTVRLNGPFGRA